MKVEIDKHPFPAVEVTCVTFTNTSGASVTLSSLGAGIVAINVPDSQGGLDNIVAGCTGKGQRLWRVCAIGDDEVQFGYCDTENGDDPSEVSEVKATYRWTEDNVLELYLWFAADSRPAVGLVNRVFLNLDGRDYGSVADEYLWLNASRYLVVGDDAPTGAPSSVEGTQLDFTEAKPLGKDFDPRKFAMRHGNGHDICWLINDWEAGVMNEAAVLASHHSRRQLSISTTLPAIHIDIINRPDRHTPDIGDTPSRDHAGISISSNHTPYLPDISQPSEHEAECRQLIFFEFSTF